MPKNRTPVPKAVAAELSARTRHTCCLCREPRQPVEIHHVNGNPSDHRLENLALLCRNCHGRVEQTGPLGRRLAPETVLRFKLEWEAECASGEGDEPILEDHEEILVKAGEYRDDWCYTLAAGNLLVVGFDSDTAVSARLGRESDFRRWVNGEDTDLIWEKASAFKAELSHEVEGDNRYVFWLDNEENEDAIVEVDIAVWSDDEDEDDEEDDED